MLFFVRFLAEALVIAGTVIVTVSACAVAIKDAYVDGVKRRLAMTALAADKERSQNELFRKAALKNTTEVMNSIQMSFVREFTKKADEYITKINNASSSTIQ